MSKNLFVVSCVIENAQNEILMIEPTIKKYGPDYWEFPGGKVELNEPPHHAVIREIKEELHLDLDPNSTESLYFTTENYPDFHLVLMFYKATQWTGEIKLEHGIQSYRWFPKSALANLKMPVGNYRVLKMI